MDESAMGPSIDAAGRRERLESWQEIATYLGLGVTTVQRCEQQNGLPIHRLPHAKKGSVFAVKSGLEAWRSTREQLGPLHPNVEREAAPAEGAEDANRSRPIRLGRRLPLIMGLGAV